MEKPRLDARTLVRSALSDSKWNWYSDSDHGLKGRRIQLLAVCFLPLPHIDLFLEPC